MAEEKKVFKTPHNVIIESRKNITVTGVMDIDSFDEESVVLFTELGELSIKGQNLHINKIDINSGDLTMEGEIESLSYSEAGPQKGSSGFFSKLFR